MRCYDKLVGLKNKLNRFKKQETENFLLLLKWDRSSLLKSNVD
jgi:hypothetical protein